MAGLAELQVCFVDTFALDPAVAVADLQFQGIPEWDSVGHMQLVAAIETTFDVMLETQEVLDLSSFGKAVEILTRHGIAF